MAKVTELDLECFSELLKSVQETRSEMVTLLEDGAKFVAAAVESEAKRNTKRDVTRRTGTLEKSWFIGEPVRYKDGSVEVKVGNNASSPTGEGEKKRLVSYAVYVENGHRTPINEKGKRGWVRGRFMLTKAIAKIEPQTQKLVERRVFRKLQEVFNK